jgi:ankyrin repeat protein
MASAIITNNRTAVQELLAEGRDVNELVQPYGEPPLHLACRRKRTDILRIVLEHGALATARNSRGETAWDILWNQGYQLTDADSESAGVLLEAGFVPEIPEGNDGRGLLHQAVIRIRNREAIEFIGRELDPAVHTPDAYGFFPLHLAAHAANYPACEALLELGADPNAELPRTLEKYVDDPEGGNLRPLYTYRIVEGSRPLDVVRSRGTRLSPSVHPLLRKAGAKSRLETRNTLPSRLDFPEWLPK